MDVCIGASESIRGWEAFRRKSAYADTMRLRPRRGTPGFSLPAANGFAGTDANAYLQTRQKIG